jgi:hypothetical protein
MGRRISTRFLVMVFKVCLKTSFVNLGIMYLAKVLVGIFDFWVNEILTTLVLRGHLYTSFGDSVPGVGNFCNIFCDGFQYSFANIFCGFVDYVSSKSSC